MEVSKYKNKSVVIVAVNGNQTAKDAAEELKGQGFKSVVLLEAPKSYPGYYNIAQQSPDYTVFVEEKAGECKVQFCKVEGYAHDRLKHILKRDTEESMKAKELYRHYLNMLELSPYMLGAKEISFEEVRYIPWYYESKSPLLYISVPAKEGAGKAIAAAIKDYFKA